MYKLIAYFCIKIWPKELSAYTCIYVVHWSRPKCYR